MSSRWLPGALATAALLLSLHAAAANPLLQVQRDFEHGRFADVLKEAEGALASAADPEARELHQLAALAAFNLGERARSDSHFRALLRLSPDHALDPYSVPPSALKHFEQLREGMRPELAALQRDARARAEAERALQRERARLAQLEQGAAQRQALALAAERERTAGAVRLASAYRPLVAWLPFGAGPFQQRRRTAGTVLAVSEGTLALGSATSFLAYYALRNRRTIQVQRDGEPQVVIERGIQPAFQERMRAWRTVNLVSTVGFFGLWLGGALEASLREPAAPPADAPTLTPALSVGADGASAGFGLRF